MREKGVFTNTKPDDLRITGMNFGWDGTGHFRCGNQGKEYKFEKH